MWWEDAALFEAGERDYLRRGCCRPELRILDRRAEEFSLTHNCFETVDLLSKEVKTWISRSRADIGKLRIWLRLARYEYRMKIGRAHV